MAGEAVPDAERLPEGDDDPVAGLVSDGVADPELPTPSLDVEDGVWESRLGPGTVGVAEPGMGESVAGSSVGGASFTVGAARGRVPIRFEAPTDVLPT